MINYFEFVGMSRSPNSDPRLRWQGGVLVLHFQAAAFSATESIFSSCYFSFNEILIWPQEYADAPKRSQNAYCFTVNLAGKYLSRPIFEGFLRAFDHQNMPNFNQTHKRLSDFADF